ncbi:MAG TPA: hypothetical protein VNO22_00605 [Planctomycetota bacterium]|nr:hypothetical protein [Planctomycetota bacterium]
MTRMLLVALLALPQEGVSLRYGARNAKDKVYVEWTLGLTLEGTDQAVTFVRSLHPFLSLEKLVLRAEGSRKVQGNRVRFEYDEARVEARYDDEDYQIDFERGVPPPDLEENKMKQFLWYLMAAGRTFTLSPRGEYRSDDPNQDHNGEAMDLVALAAIRFPEGSVRPGETFEVQWKGERSEKNKKGRYAFRQKAVVEKIEDRSGTRVATVSSELSGTLEAPPEERDRTAEEAWTRCEGKMRAEIEVESGRVLSSEGSGKVVSYYRAPAGDGGKNEFTLTLTASGKVRVR